MHFNFPNKRAVDFQVLIHDLQVFIASIIFKSIY